MDRNTKAGMLAGVALAEHALERENADALALLDEAETAISAHLENCPACTDLARRIKKFLEKK